jgi:hypothetical protein
MKLAAGALVTAVVVAVVLASCASGDDLAARREASAECLSQAGGLYQQKIAPLLATDRPQTCNQCHLSGVDLSLFVRANMCETRACLVDLGLVDLANPDQSKVLAWIARAQPDSTLITQDVIDQEYDAFKSFVEQMATCGGESCAGVRCPASSDEDACGPDVSSEPDGATEVPAGTSCDLPTMETQFLENVYAWRDRCFPCHFTSQPGSAPGAPPWIDTRNGCNAGSLETFHNVVTMGLLDSSYPTESLLLLKPLNAPGVKHGGGAKFDGENDPSYKSFLSFIEYWVSCGSVVP